MRYGPFAYPGYRWLWSGQLVSIIGDQLFPMALVRIALDRPQPILSLGMIFGARFVALACLIVVGGVLADRLDKFRLMISSDVIRVAGVSTLIGVGAGAPIWVLVLVTFGMGAGESLLQPSYDAL
ncbi:MAG: MFS transporter, partial [Mycobacterium sp.]|nr:MFS transporter [Mycobacterium sp.]